MLEAVGLLGGFQKLLTHTKQGSSTQNAENPIPKSKILVSTIKINDLSRRQIKKKKKTSKCNKIY